VAGINIFSTQNLDGRIDVSAALGSKETAMFIYDLSFRRSTAVPYSHGEEGWEKAE
jgi:hypothetical protein